MASPHSIKDYYAGATLFITGGSGFMGKTIIEKLLRTCSDVDKIYTLLRGKKGFSSADRLERMKNKKVFDLVRAKDPRLLDKLYFVTGDINEDHLGLNETDAELLIRSVNIVIHSAATVRFNAPVKEALNTNVLGTKRVLDLCVKFDKLKSIVHISTAFSNPGIKVIEEKVYKPSQKLDLEWFINCANALDNDLAIKVFQNIYGFFPNTYSLTKNMTEILVEDYRARHKLPLVIVRPSIVGCSYEEPLPGWVDSLNGVTGVATELGRGTIGSFICTDCNMEMVPLDLANNMILVAPWFDAIKPKMDIRVINFNSGDRNGVTWPEAFEIVNGWSRKYPSKYTMMYPHSMLTTNMLLHNVLTVVHTYVPAILADVVLRIMKQKPMMYDIQKKFRVAVNAEMYFATHGWNWKYDNVLEAIRVAKGASDFGEFNFDVCSFTWDEYIKRYVLGIQKFMLNSGEEQLPRARKMLKIMYAAWLFYYACLIGLALYALYLIFF